MLRIPRRNLVLGAPCLLVCAKTAHAANDDLVVIVNRSSDVTSLSRGELEAIFTTRRRYWSGSRKIVAFNLPPRTPERVHFDRVILRLEPAQSSQFWIDRKVRGGAAPPRSVPDVKLLVQLVAAIEDSIAYVPAALATTEVRKIVQISGAQIVASNADEWFNFGDVV